MDAYMENPGEIIVSSQKGGRGSRLLIGTCGYSYLEWADSGFYPPNTKSAEMLALYGRRFSVVELNYTWYQMARAEALSRMVAAAPAHMLFTAKLTRTMTHERDRDWRKQAQLYCRGIKALGERLLAVLVQLPPDFQRTVDNRRFLAELFDNLQDLPVAVEFRHVSWATDSVFAELERRRVTLVTVDVPEMKDLFPALDVVTNPNLFYVRFHGRNLQGWRSGNMQKKFDHDYTEAELQQWCRQYLEKMSSCAARGVIFFNNHVRGQAPGNAGLLAALVSGNKCG